MIKLQCIVSNPLFHDKDDTVDYVADFMADMSQNQAPEHGEKKFSPFESQVRLALTAQFLREALAVPKFERYTLYTYN